MVSSGLNLKVHFFAPFLDDNAERGRKHSSGWRSGAQPACQACFFFQAEDGIRNYKVTGVQTCALPISPEESRWHRLFQAFFFHRLAPAARSAGAVHFPVLDRKSTRLNSSHPVISY